MTPGRYEIRLYRGDSWGITVQLLESDGVLIDLTAGWSARAHIRRNDMDRVPLVEIAVVLEAAENRFALSLSKEQTAGMADYGVWDLETTDPGGLVRTVLAGPVTLTRDVTL